jgi:Tfp pilus assembly protein PilO
VTASLVVQVMVALVVGVLTWWFFWDDDRPEEE